MIDYFSWGVVSKNNAGEVIELLSKEAPLKTIIL
jgi:hypothetical protein